MLTLQRNTAPAPSRILRPGIRSFVPGVERYVVPGGGSVVVEVKAGDHAAVTDLEGGQACEVVFADGSGAVDPSGLGATADGTAEGLKALLAGGRSDAQRTVAALKRRGIDPAKLRSTGLFGVSSTARSSASFTAARDGILIIAAPAKDMSPEAQDTATDIELRITRAQASSKKPYDLLPEPLADPLQDIRIKAAMANAYLVRAGEYIQVIDVAGRQCTDFQAFAARKVDKGLDFALDSTVTRTLLGGATPRRACRPRPSTASSSR